MSTLYRQPLFVRCYRRMARGSAGMLAAAAALVGCVDQPKPGCIATTNSFAVKLIELERVESVRDACAPFGPASFHVEPVVGLSPYYTQGSDRQPDYERGSLAVQTAELGTLFYAAEGMSDGDAPGAQPFSFGAFSQTEPDGDNLCSVPTLSLTQLLLPELPAVADDPATADTDETFAGRAAIDATLDWSNVRVYVTADTFGTQMDGDLVDTRRTPEGGSCAITYKALGLAPAISCGVFDADGAQLTNADGSFQLDPAACEPTANPDEGRPIGSGIGPSARFECNPETAYCMIEGDTFPAFR